MITNSKQGQCPIQTNSWVAYASETSNSSFFLQEKYQLIDR